MTLGVDGIPPGFYEVKKLHVRKGSKSVDRRFKAGQRGERIYGRRDAEIKAFAQGLENYLDGRWDDPPVGGIHWGREAVEDLHDFIDQALERRHGKKFDERLRRLAEAACKLPGLLPVAYPAARGGVSAQNIANGFASLSGIFVMAGNIYTLVKPKEYTRFIGFDSASAEGPKLSYLGVVPLGKFEKKISKK